MSMSFCQEIAYEETHRGLELSEFVAWTMGDSPRGPLMFSTIAGRAMKSSKIPGGGAGPS